MASSILAVLVCIATILLSAAADDCDSYFNKDGQYIYSKSCSYFQFCCGTCDNRYCCSESYHKLNDDNCFPPQTVPVSIPRSDHNIIPIATGVVAVIVMLGLVITCCICPCCCLYKMCRKPRPITTTTTTLVTTQYPQQPPPSTSSPYPAYQTVPAQPGYGVQPMYGGQPMPPAPFQGPTYSHGPPPPYQETGIHPAPYSQAAYDGGQAPYPLNPPVQPGFAHPPAANSAVQPPYNPAYMEPPKTGY